jgi:hypothetical protein
MLRSRTEIKYEVEETVTLRLSENVLTRFCPQCRADVPMAAPELVARKFTYSEREIFRLIETGAVHFVESQRILICLPSARNALEEK